MQSAVLVKSFYPVFVFSLILYSFLNRRNVKYVELVNFVCNSQNQFLKPFMPE